MALDHPYGRLPMPSNAPFALMPSPGKGWGAFATRRIERGATILSEDPLFTIQKPHAEITAEDVIRAFQQLPASRKALFFLLRDNASKDFRSMEHAFAENSFNMGGEDRGGRQLNGPHGLFLLHSRFNHSCLPNSKIPNNSTGIASLQSFAIKDIVPGEEITFSYEGDFGCRTREERHRELRFICNCEACQLGTPFQRLSDMRRRLIRGLQYLQLGKDLDGQKQEASERSLITDIQLRIAAETFEGLLDDFLAERLSPSVIAVASTFQTENNAKVAKLAMAQGTWLGRLCVAFHLYGQADAADRFVAEALRCCSLHQQWILDQGHIYLFMAASFNCRGMVRHLVKLGARPDSSLFKTEPPPTMSATVSGDIEAADLLVKICDPHQKLFLSCWAP